MRCLTLADSLRLHGVDSLFICRRLNGHLGEYIREKGFAIEWIESGHDDFCPEEDARATKEILKRAAVVAPIAWLIVDHYGIGSQWELHVKPFVKRLLVIDDLANRSHEGDMLLDQNAYDGIETRYRDLVPARCIRLLGPRYLLLRPSFYRTRSTLRERDGILRRLLVFFGGSDPSNETEKVLNALTQWRGGELPFHTDIVIGAANPYRKEIAALCAKLNKAALHVQTEKMAELIAEADFALGAGGVAMWERCYLGLPSGVTVIASNQAASALYAAKAGAVRLLGESERTNADAYLKIIQQALASPRELTIMSERALTLTESRSDRMENPVVLSMLELD